jgi:hypothetical protein
MESTKNKNKLLNTNSKPEQLSDSFVNQINLN